jgi:TRAP transporter TAXI family solute receptor
MPRPPVRAIASLCAALLLAAGCGAGGEESAGSGVPSEALILGTGPVGGTYYPLGGAMVQMWNEELGEPSVTAIATGGSVENLQMLAAGEVHLAMALDGTAARAAAGSAEFEGRPVDLALLGNLYPEVVQVAAGRDSGIAELADLAGKRVAVGPPGSGTRVVAEVILDAAGVVPAELVAEDFGAAALALASGEIDAAFGVLAAPDTALAETARSAGLVLVPLPEEVRAELLAGDPTLVPTEIPGGTYAGVDAPTATVRSWAALYASVDLDEGRAHALVEALYEHAEGIGNTAAEAIDAAAAVESPPGVDLHPGAERYFAEQGT